MRFTQPYFIPPHTVKRFQERVANLPAFKVIILIQAALQGNHPIGMQIYNHKPCPVYKAKYRDKEYLMPVCHNDREWPQVPTILFPGMKIYGIRERSDVL